MASNWNEYVTGLSKNFTRESIDECINTISKRYNLSIDEIKSIILNESNVKDIGPILFEGKYYPRYFPDAAIMNEDPDRYLLKMPTDRLLELVKLASYLYYNYEGGGINDNTFDALEYTLNKRLKLKGRRYEKIGAPPVDKIKSTLPYPMPSLNKVKPGSRELYNFIENTPAGIYWSDKLDGVSGLVEFFDGECKDIYTRGDGNIGGKVSYLNGIVRLGKVTKTIKITDHRYKNIVVRGEFVVPRKVWNEKYQVYNKNGRAVGEYSNPRSFVSAKINSGNITDGLNDIVFVAYAIIDIPGNSTQQDEIIPSPEESMTILSNLGFNTVTGGVLIKPVVFDIMSLYRRRRLESEYNIDGLVLSENAITVKRAIDQKLAVNPKSTVAFKMRLEEQIRETKVMNIEWNVSRYGRMIPVVIYESVYIDGARLHRASAFNAYHVKDWSLGKGTKIKIIRSGDVIPTILSVDTNTTITPIYPHPIVPGALGKDKGWHWHNKDIVVDDIDNNRIVQLKRSEHFFTTIGVPRLREKTLEKLWDAGIRTIRAITNAKISDFAKIKGIGKKTSEYLYKTIHSTMRNTRLDRYIPASTTLNIGIGRKLVKQLLNYHPTLMEDSPETLKIMLTKKNIPGIGVKRIQNIVDSIENFKSFLYSLNKDDIDYAIKHDSERIKTILSRGYSSKIRGKSFVFTGFFGKIDYDIEDYIYDNFGSIVPNVNPSVEAVVSANLLNVTSKMLTAERLKVKVLSIEEFIKEYNIPTKTSPGEEEKEVDRVDIDAVEGDDYE